jgi:PAS domain S-box-containing protein
MKRTPGTPVFDVSDNSVRLFGTAHDINNGVCPDEVIAMNGCRFKAVFEHSLDGMMLADDTGRFLDVNPAICELLGYTREELLQMTFADITPVPEREHFPELLSQFLAVPSMQGELALLCKDGQIRRGEYRAVRNILPGVHLSVHRDSTEQNKARDALRQSEQKFRFLAESIPHMVWTSGADGYGDYHNSRFLDYLGFVPEQKEGDDWTDFIHPDDRSQVVNAWNLALRTTTEFRVEFRMRDAKTGEYRWFHGHALPQRENDGSVVRWCLTCTEIDQQKRATEALKKKR